MTDEHRLHMSLGVAVIAALSILVVGAGGMYLLMGDGQGLQTAPLTVPATSPISPQPTSPDLQRESGDVPDVVISLSKDAVERAGIEVTQVKARAIADSIRLPGVVQPNAYRQVAVTPLVSGRVVEVSSQLGDRVRKGQSLGSVYSPDVAEARTKYLAASAMLDAHDRELQRTEKLVEIGAASRRELEQIHAEHAAQTAEVESARSRLRLFGAGAVDGSDSTRQEGATIELPAPIDGVVIERLANVGLNVDPSTKLFTVVDLSSVWIVADVYERDVQRVREGAHATLTMASEPDRPREGRVSFIDPQLDAATRTARIRVEVGNPRNDLRLGMYADVVVAIPDTRTVLSVPQSAVQTVDDKQFVYLASLSEPATFIERAVRLGRTMGDYVEVLAGVSAGDVVVSKGSFFVRAEAERLGLRAGQAPALPTPAATVQAGASTEVVNVRVTEKGFEPNKVSLRAGSPARLAFVRTTDKTCGTEVVFPSLNIRRQLPLNESVAIDVTPARSGEIAFACGMNMLKGVIVVQ